MKQLYLMHGPPEILVHDQGGEFWSEVMRQLAELLEIQPSKITSHRPSANAVVERVHATLHSMFGKLVKKNQRDWCELTPYVTYAYNTTIHSATGFSPFYLMHLRRARVPLELLIGTPTEAAYESEDTYVTAASERMRLAYSLVREQLRASFDGAKKRYDERVRTTRFAVGDFVWHFILHRCKGLNRKWLLGNRGPYRIVRKINEVNFVVKKSPKAQEEIVHIDRLTKYKNTVPPQWRKEVERERDEQGRNDARETGLASAPRKHGETDPKKRSRMDNSPSQDHLESVNEPSAKAPRRSKTTNKNVIVPTNIPDQNGGQPLAKERVNPGKRKVQAKSRSDTWNRDQLTRSAAQRQAGSMPDRTCMTGQEGTVIPQGRRLKY